MCQLFIEVAGRYFDTMLSEANFRWAALLLLVLQYGCRPYTRECTRLTAIQASVRAEGLGSYM